MEKFRSTLALVLALCGCSAEAVQEPSPAKPPPSVSPGGAIELLQVRPAQATVPQEVDLKLRGSVNTMGYHVVRSTPTEFEIDSTLFRKTEIVSQCLAMRVTLTVDEKEQLEAGEQERSEAPTLVAAVPLKHESLLDDGLYAERIRIAWSGGDEPDFSSYRFFATRAGAVTAISGEQYAARVQFEEGSAVVDDYDQRGDLCTTVSVTSANEK
jgi:hypothetical protein